MSKAKACLPKTRNGRNHPLTISAMAAEIAQLRRIAEKMDDADSHQRQNIKSGYTGPVIPFESRRRDADDRACALEELILTTEPDNLDEAFSLALVTLGKIDGAYVDESSETAQAHTALATLARWMIRDGARSPLPHEYYAGWRLKPQAEEIEAALARAAELAQSKTVNA